MLFMGNGEQETRIAWILGNPFPQQAFTSRVEERQWKPPEESKCWGITDTPERKPENTPKWRQKVESFLLSHSLFLKH